MKTTPASYIPFAFLLLETITGESMATARIHVWIFGDQHYRVMTSRVAEAIVKQL